MTIKPEKAMKELNKYIKELDELLKTNYKEGEPKAQELHTIIKDTFIEMAFKDGAVKRERYMWATAGSARNYGNYRNLSKAKKQKIYEDDLELIKTQLNAFKVALKLEMEEKEMITVKCAFCGGTGKQFDIISGKKPCPSCGGHGEHDFDVSPDSIVDCNYCHGSGKDINLVSGDKLCPVCKGVGSNPIYIAYELRKTCNYCDGTGIEGYDTINRNIRCKVCDGVGITSRPSIKTSNSSKRVTPASPVTEPSKHSFDIVISFAGEDRDKVSEYAKLLKNANVNYFLSELKEAYLWGKDGVEILEDIFGRQGKYCVMFISKSYAEKPWPKHEKRSALARALKEDREYILPVKLDDTKIPGIPETVFFIDLRIKTIEQLAELTLEKLSL